jgi:hypothetical protein
MYTRQFLTLQAEKQDNLNTRDLLFKKILGNRKEIQILNINFIWAYFLVYKDN